MLANLFIYSFFNLNSDTLHLGPSTAASMASSNIEPHPESFVFCDNHSEDLVRFFCNVCEVSLCQQCWDSDHVDWKTHNVSMIGVNLEPQKQIEMSLSEYKTECDKMNSLFSSNDWNMIHQKVQTAEKEQKLILKMNSVKQVETKSETVRTLLSSHKASFQDFKKKVLSQFEVMEQKYATIFGEKLEDCDEEDSESVRSGSKPNNDKQLSKRATDIEHQPLSGFDRPQALHQSISQEDGSGCKTDKNTSAMRTEDTEVRLERQKKLVGVTKSEIGGTSKFFVKASYNTYTREIICLSRFPDTISVIDCVKLQLTRQMDWEEMRGASDELHDLTLDKNNNLYLSIHSKRNYSKKRVEIVNTKNFQKTRALDTNGIINGEDKKWFLCAKNDTVLLAVLDCNREREDYEKWVSVTIYHNQMRRCTVPLSILNCNSAMSLQSAIAMLNESTLLISIDSRPLVVAVVSLPTNYITTQTSSKSNFKSKKLSTKQPGSVNIFLLNYHNCCNSLVWMPSEGLNSSHPLNGCLWAAGFYDHTCHIYRVDFEKEISKIENETEKTLTKNELVRLEKIESIEPTDNLFAVHCTVDDCTIFATSLTKGRSPLTTPVLLNLQFKPET